MAKRYTVGYVNEAVPPLLGHSRTVALVMEEELGAEPFSHQSIMGIIRMAADSKRIGQYVDVDKVFEDLTQSGFLTYEGHL